MEITKEEYLAALEIVDNYHNQILNKRINVRRLSRYKTREFINNHEHEMSTRLHKTLINAVNEGEKGGDNNPYTQYLYVEDLSYNNLNKIRAFGKKSWLELENLIDKYLK